MIKIPIFIIVHNQYEILKKSVESYEKYIKTPIEIIFHNVCSTYFETINYLKEKQNEGYIIYNSDKNDHHTVINSIKDYISKNPTCEYIVMTDPDIELNKVNGDILEFYIYLLNKLKKTTVGPMLKIDDIPDEYPNKKQCIEGHTIQFWSKPSKTILFKDKEYKYIECLTDTTFQLFSSKNIPTKFPHINSIRTLYPYDARHLDWYVNPNNLSPCQLYYLNNTNKISHWNNKNFNGKYYNNNINIINNFFINKYKYVYYYDKCKCSNNYNFGDFITPFIYKSLFLKNPILDINGGKKKADVVIGAGSILDRSTTNSIIWGSGFMFGNETIQNPKKILSVRGPLTRNRLLKLGIECPESYGDIGLILPYFYYPTVEKKYKLGIIPHYIDKPRFNEIYKNNDKDVKIIDVTEPIQNVINNILACEMTISSSLHGIIVSHAYNVKCMWIQITNKIGGGNFKYRDYYGSLKFDNYNEILPYIYTEQISTNETIKLINDYPNPIFPINTKSIMELCPFIDINKSSLTNLYNLNVDISSTINNTIISKKNNNKRKKSNNKRKKSNKKYLHNLKIRRKRRKRFLQRRKKLIG
jgi:pyruvyltransferase